MTRQEEMILEEKAKELAYKYFPNEENIWARDNVEATKTMIACMEMSNFILDKACEWLQHNVYRFYWTNCTQQEHGVYIDKLLEELRKAMEGD